MQESSSHSDRFHPEMPAIPGISDAPARSRSTFLARSLLLAAALVLLGIMGWGLRNTRIRSHATAGVSAGAGIPLPPVTTDAVAPELASQTEPGVKEVAKLDELAAPWASKKFTFNDPVTHAEVAALIVRLPGGAADRSSSYWAFSLRAPYASCDLEYVTDPAILASRYSFHATHPMVLAPCDGTVYDPLQLGNSPTGAWVRGEIVQGVGIRPPLAIEVRVQKDIILADNME